MFLALIARQFKGNDRDRQAHILDKAGRIILNKFRSAGCAHNHRIGLESFNNVERGGLEKLGGILAQIPGLKSRIGDRGTLAAPFDHSEQ